LFDGKGVRKETKNNKSESPQLFQSKELVVSRHWRLAELLFDNTGGVEEGGTTK